MPLPQTPLADLEQVLDRTEALWRALAGERLLVTGGTGFMGSWLLETLVLARERLGLDLRAVVLSRDAAAFRRRAPRVAGAAAVEWLAGDVASYPAPAGGFGAVVHAATDTRADAQRADPRATAESIVAGTARTLAHAEAAGAGRFLYLSSGAVYGPQPATLAALPEDYPGAPPLAAGSVYGAAKRLAETLCVAAAGARLQPTIARCFAFVGPQLPLDAHFAVGNFIGDAAAGRPIEVRSDGRALRSYMHAVDLTIWLLTLLVRGRPGRAYNVGSDRAVSIGELAGLVAAAAVPPVPVRVRDPAGTGPAHRYVPDTTRARAELGLELEIDLPEALRRTLLWARQGSDLLNLNKAS